MMDSLSQGTVEQSQNHPIPGPLPSVNGVVLIAPDESISTDELRQRACSEMLRQTAIQEGLLPADDPAPESGVMSEEASEAIETLLDRELQAAEEPDESACRRYYEGHAAQFTRGERVQARHVLFAVTPGVDVNALRKRAEACLLDLRCETPGETNRFASVAASTSNCPSGAEGGQLGWLVANDCAPEFSREIFGKPEIGVLPRLVHSRFGLHVIEVIAREPGVLPEFEAVQSAVALALERQRYATALRQYLQLLAGQSRIEGVDLQASSDPLVQ
jgi:peptidyl-prolyl cis-trans isomerase C